MLGLVESHSDQFPWGDKNLFFTFKIFSFFNQHFTLEVNNKLSLKNRAESTKLLSGGRAAPRRTLPPRPEGHG